MESILDFIVIEKPNFIVVIATAFKIQYFMVIISVFIKAITTAFEIPYFIVIVSAKVGTFIKIKISAINVNY